MNIQELGMKYKEIGAEIERLKKQPEGILERTAAGGSWMVDWTGGVSFRSPKNNAAVTHHNVYKNESLAIKASVLQRRANLVIQTCLNFDPDFVPDWSNSSEIKYGPYYCHRRKKWSSARAYLSNASAAFISTQEISDKVLDYLNSQKIN